MGFFSSSFNPGNTGKHRVSNAANIKKGATRRGKLTVDKGKHAGKVKGAKGRATRGDNFGPGDLDRWG